MRDVFEIFETGIGFYTILVIYFFSRRCWAEESSRDESMNPKWLRNPVFAETHLKIAVSANLRLKYSHWLAKWPSLVSVIKSFYDSPLGYPEGFSDRVIGISLSSAFRSFGNVAISKLSRDCDPAHVPLVAYLIESFVVINWYPAFNLHKWSIA